MRHSILALVTFLGYAGSSLRGDENSVPRTNTGGPAGLVTGLAFSPDGETLYAAGMDKVVHIWQLQGKEWKQQPALRAPLGPGADGKLNALALSRDGRWLAVAGSAAVRTRTGFRETGIVIPAAGLDADSRRDQGVIHVFDTRTRDVVATLRGHEGAVFALAFAPSPQDERDLPPTLVSAARHWSDKTGSHQGALWMWNVAKGTHRDWPGELPDPRGLDLKRPGLAIVPGPAGEPIVAVAWGDGKLRSWEIGRGAEGAVEKEDRKFNVTVAPSADGKTVLSGGVTRGPGYLRTWTAQGLAQPKAKPLPTRDGSPDFSIPLAVAPLALAAGKPADHAALLVFVQKTGQGEVRLHLVNVDPASVRYGMAAANLGLWPYDQRLPTVAADPQGRYLAVAGNTGDEVRVYSLKALLGGDEAGREPVRLGSVCIPLLSGAFARGPDGLGLVLSEAKKPQAGTVPAELAKGDLLFDFRQPGLGDVKGWQLERHETDGWQVAAGKDGARPFLDVKKDETQRILFAKEETLNEWALSPAGVGRSVPIVAVALQNAGEPELRLYRADTGALVRHFTGHDGPIRSLAFSKDGRLLVSVAEDRLVCVWTLTDLDETLDQHAAILNLAVKDGPGKSVLVSRILEGSPALDKLQSGDVVEALALRDGKMQPLQSARQFYEAIFDRKPGGQITLQVKGRAPLTLPLAQGVDERHPLLTLFFTRPAQGEEREWLGWSPQGPYEASSGKVQRYLGWHTNTGDAKHPVAFAAAGKYRAKFEKKGLLGQLVAKGSLDLALAALRPPPPPDPAVILAIGDVVLNPAQTDSLGQIRVQASEHVMRLSVFDFPLDKLRSSEWSVDGGPWQAFAGVGVERSAELPASFGRGPHTLRIRLRTPEGRLPEYEHTWRIRYQPPPPTIASPLPRRVFLEGEEFVLEAVVKPGAAELDVESRVIVNGKTVETAAGLTIKRALRIPKGTSRIAIVARNKGALAGHEDAETNTLTFEVTYDPKAPRIALTEVIPLPDGKREGEARPIIAGGAVVVDSSTVRLRGTISAAETLLEAAVGTSAVDLKSEPRQLRFDELVKLRPGPQKIALTARTRNTETKYDIDVHFQPPLPRLRLLPPKHGLTIYDEGKGMPTVRLTFQADASEDPGTPAHGVQAVVLVNGKPLAPTQVEWSGRELQVEFVPTDRENQVQVQLKSEWQAAATAATLTIRALRPPHSLRLIDVAKQSQDPVIALSAKVESHLPLIPANVEATVNGQPIRAVEVGKDNGTTWHLLLKEVSLNPARGSVNHVRVQVRNPDGPARQPAEGEVVFVGPPPKRPELTLLEPGNANLTDPRALVRFVIRSESPLKHVTLSRDGTADVVALDLTGWPDGADVKLALRLGGEGGGATLAPKLTALKPDAQGFRETDVGLALDVGLNRLRVEAANEAGLLARSAVVNLLPPPVRVVIDRLESPEDGKALPWLGEGRFAGAAPVAKMWLRGRILWSPAHDDRLKTVQTIHVRVNGVRQSSAVPLDKPGAFSPRERSFRAPVFLSQAMGNRLDLEVPGLELDDAARVEYVADCERPLPEKRLLHLLIVGAGEKDGARLRAGVLRALHAKALPGREFELPAFDRGLLYGPVVRDVEPDQVYYEIAQIHRGVERLASTGSTSNVVLVYFQGGETIDPAGHFLIARGGDLTAGRVIPCESLEKRLVGLLGAQIVLIDVERRKTDAPDARRRDFVLNWPSDSPIAVVRLTRLGEAADEKKLSLIDAWQTPLSRNVLLSDVEGQVRLQLEPFLSREPGAIFYHPYIPHSLRALAIGKRQE